MVDDRRLHTLLSSRATAQRVVEALISEANGRGGLDNITAIVVRIVATDADMATEKAGVAAVSS
jgi:protein phosphatase